MKKNLVFLIVLMTSMSLSAKVAYLQRFADPASYRTESAGGVDQKPEKNAYDWFNTNYVATGKGAFVGTDAIPTNTSTYDVLWINVDQQGQGAWNDDLVGGSSAIANIKSFIEAGGNVLLTKQAAWIVPRIGRMKYDNGLDYNPLWSNNNYAQGNDVWTINAMIGAGVTLRDARQHPIFSGMSTSNQYAHESFPMIGTVQRVDNNYIWTEMDPKAGGDTPNDNIATLNNFQSDWKCEVLAVWGHVRDYCGPAIVEFHPQGDFNGSIMTISSNAYQWGTSNDYISNVQKLTENALSYLDHNGTDIGYLMPYALSELSTPTNAGDDPTYKPDLQAAKWFYDNYVVTNKGCFIYPWNDIPSDMKVIWINNDRVNLTPSAFYSHIGGDTYKSKLETFLSKGGNLYLSKRATYVAFKLDKIYEPGDSNGGYVAPNSDAWAVNAGSLGFGLDASCHQDRSHHPIYRYMTVSEENSITYDNGTAHVYIPYPTFKLVDLTQRTNNNNMWNEMDRKDGSREENESLTKLANFESDWQCKVLGVWGQVQNFCGAGLIEFGPDSRGGKVIANGFAAYQWGTNNSDATAIGNVRNLTKGILEYLLNERNLQDCPNCFVVY